MVSLDWPPPWPPGVVTWLLLLIFGTWERRGESQLAHVISEGVTAPVLGTDLLYHPHWSWEAGQRRAVWCGVVIKIIVAHYSVLSITIIRPPLSLSLNCIICFLFLSATRPQCQPLILPGSRASVLIPRPGVRGGTKVVFTPDRPGLTLSEENEFIIFDRARARQDLSLIWPLLCSSESQLATSHQSQQSSPPDWLWCPRRVCCW